MASNTSADLRFLISDLFSALAKVIIIDYIVSGENPLSWHSKFNEIVNVALSAHERGSVKTYDPPLDHFLQPGARFVSASAL